MHRLVLVFAALLPALHCAAPERPIEEVPDAGDTPRTDAGDEPDAGRVEPDAGTVETRRTWPPERPGYVNPVLAENARPGDAQWSRFSKKAAAGQIEGYADRVAARAGERVGLHVSADANATAAWQLYRIGWYGGTGARRVSEGNIAVSPQPRCPLHATLGRVRCDWPVTTRLEIPADAVAGLYLVKLVRDDGWGSWVPLVVADDRPADLLFQASVTTWQAYNDWGGASLYRDKTGSLPFKRAVEVSFDRPYTEGVGAGQLLKWEVHLARFLEKAGYDVTYTTNLEVAAHDGAWLAGRGAFLSMGHDEYWTKSQRDAVEDARARGVPLLFFTSNAAYWQVRLGDDAGHGARTMTGYKESWASDPVQGAEVTARFRDAPINRPENGLMGVMLDKWQNVRGPLVVADPDHFLFRGTGLARGEAVYGLMGYETDGRFDNGFEPAGLRVAASTGVVGVEGTTGRAEAVSYVGSGGGLVFSTGSIEWAYGLGGSDIVDPRVERMTANVLEEALGLEPAHEIAAGTTPRVRIDGPFADAVTTLARDLANPVAVAPLGDGGFAFVDARGSRILRVGPAPERRVTVLAGDGAGLTNPTGLLALDGSRLLVADSKNHCIRELSLGAAPSLRTVAGRCGTSAYIDGAAADARFAFPMGLAVDPTTGEVLVADSWNNRVRGLDLVTGTVRTLAGTGERASRDGPAAEAAFSYPTAVAADGSGRVYVVSSGSFTIARIDVDSLRTVTTLAGGKVGADDGSGDTARLGPQAGLVISDGVLFVSDPGAGRIRRVVPGATAATTVVSTLAGAARFGVEDGPGDAARFSLPLGLALDAGGALLVADAEAGTVRRVVP